MVLSVVVAVADFKAQPIRHISLEAFNGNCCFVSGLALDLSLPRQCDRVACVFVGTKYRAWGHYRASRSQFSAPIGVLAFLRGRPKSRCRRIDRANADGASICERCVTDQFNESLTSALSRRREGAISTG